MDNFESLLKLALCAQSQCARTLEALSAIKNPPNMAFVKQANIAYNQQINNGTSWEKATGPKTADSKAKISRNAYKGGYRKLFRELNRALKEQRRMLDKF